MELKAQNKFDAENKQVKNKLFIANTTSYDIS